MHQETMGIKLSPRQLRELTDARTIAIMATTLAHYCKKFCDINTTAHSSEGIGGMSRQRGRNELNFSLLKSSTINFDTMSVGSHTSRRP